MRAALAARTACTQAALRDAFLVLFFLGFRYAPPQATCDCPFGANSHIFAVCFARHASLGTRPVSFVRVRENHLGGCSFLGEAVAGVWFPGFGHEAFFEYAFGLFEDGLHEGGDADSG